MDVSSDDEPFEEKKPASKRQSADRANKPRNSKAARSKDCPGCGATFSVSIKECSYCDYQFTSKSMLITAQSAAEESRQIRETFAFEPERVRVFLFIFLLRVIQLDDYAYNSSLYSILTRWPF